MQRGNLPAAGVGAEWTGVARINPLSQVLLAMTKETTRRAIEVTASRQLALAAKSDVLLGFQLRHLEQPHQHAKPVTPRHPREVGDRLSNEDGGLVRSAIP